MPQIKYQCYLNIGNIGDQMANFLTILHYSKKNVNIIAIFLDNMANMLPLYATENMSHMKLTQYLKYILKTWFYIKKIAAFCYDCF